MHVSQTRNDGSHQPPAAHKLLVKLTLYNQEHSGGGGAPTVVDLERASAAWGASFGLVLQVSDRSVIR